MVNQLRKYCIEILEILRSASEDNWIETFEYLVRQSDIMSTKDLRNEIYKIYKGVGSFNDLILYQNGQLIYDKNEKLDKLRKSLFLELGNI